MKERNEQQIVQEHVLGQKLLSMIGTSMTEETLNQHRLVRRMAYMGYRYQYGDKSMRDAVKVECVGGIPGYAMIRLLDEIFNRMKTAGIIDASSRMDVLRNNAEGQHKLGWEIGLRPGEEKVLYKNLRGKPRQIVIDAIRSTQETPIDPDLIRQISGSSDVERMEKAYGMAKQKMGVDLGI